MSTQSLRIILATVAFAFMASGARRAEALGTCGKGGVTGTRTQVPFDGSVYYVTTPASYADSRPWPIIFGLHGDEGDPAKSVNSLWSSVTNDQFIFIAPKAPNVANMGSWYKDQATNEAWMDRLLNKVFAEYNVDVDRIYIWGLSGGAVFISSYVMKRQNIFAAAEWNMGGSKRTYVEPPNPSCKVPTRFVVSMTDFLRDNALMLHALFQSKGHEAVWVDANCVDHCFDKVEAGPRARDWMLAHTHCGGMTAAGCGRAGDLPGGPITPVPDAGAGPDSGAGGSGGGSGGSGGSGGGSGGSGGSAGSGGGGSGGTGGSGGGTGGTDGGAGGNGGGAGGNGGSGGGPGAGGEPDVGGGCACVAAGAAPGISDALFGVLVASGLTIVRRRRRG